MHSYLIIGKDEEKVEKLVKKILSSLSSNPRYFSLTKIEDVRELKSWTKLKTPDPLTYILRSIDSATHEAQNAFLKNLEEPNSNISYILTANSEHNLLPTIVSRCLLIKEHSPYQISKKDMSQGRNFLDMNNSEKLLFLSSIKKRDEAIKVIEQFVLAGHNMLLSKNTDYLKIVSFIRTGTRALSALKANGNVTLALTNYVVNLKY